MGVYADKFVEFQGTLQEAMRARVALCDCPEESIPECRENLHNLEVKCLKLYNDMLTLVQKAGLLDEDMTKKEKV